VYVTTVKESSEISQLQQENAQLRQSLDDHHSAIELIMSRYRSSVSRLVAANRRQRAQYEAPSDHSQVRTTWHFTDFAGWVVGRASGCTGMLKQFTYSAFGDWPVLEWLHKYRPVKC